MITYKFYGIATIPQSFILLWKFYFEVIMINNGIEEVIKEAKVKIEAEKENLLESYFTIIMRIYRSSTSVKRSALLSSMDSLVYSLDIESSCKSAEVGTKEKVRKNSNSNFDLEEAIRIREEAGLSKADLCRELRLSKSGSSVISRYERGLEKPGNPPKGKIAKKYLDWLKQQGYDPFGL